LWLGVVSLLDNNWVIWWHPAVLFTTRTACIPSAYKENCGRKRRDKFTSCLVGCLDTVADTGTYKAAPATRVHDE